MLVPATFVERRKQERQDMFRKYNGISERLQRDKNYLYLKADKDNFCFATAKDTEVSIMRAVQESIPKKVILDLECITRMDSAAIGVLIHLRTECSKNTIDVVLTKVRPEVKKVFDLLSMSTFFQITDNIDELA